MNATTAAPVRATWKAHGNPAAFTFYGNGAKPADTGIPATVTAAGGSLTFVSADGDPITKLGGSAKFWAAVPADDSALDDLLTGPPATADEKAAAKAKRAAEKAERDAEKAAAVAQRKADREKARAEREAAEAARPKRVLNPDTAAELAALIAERVAAAGDTLPAGYTMRWAYPAGHSRLQKDDAAADGPKWYSRCDLHATLEPADDSRSAWFQGFTKNRTGWCAECKAAEKAKATEKAKAEKAKATAAAERAEKAAARKAADEAKAAEKAAAEAAPAADQTADQK